VTDAFGLKESEDSENSGTDSNGSRDDPKAIAADIEKAKEATEQ